jgi:DNA-binding NarL/FixJ family response regulator
MTAEPLSAPPIRILVVDDHPAVRQGLALLLAPGKIVVCGECSTGSEAQTLAVELAPDLVLVDLSLADEDGLAVVRALGARGIPSLVYSMHVDGRHIEASLTAGSLGYVTKREIHRVLVEAIRSVAAGRRFVSPIASAALAEHLAGHPTRRPVRDLSEQEREVYRLLGEGEGTLEIASALRISTRTVESYFTRIQEKLGLRGMHQLRRQAILDGRGPGL